MSRSISRACVALAALLLSIALALGATLCLAPTAHADEATIFSQKLTKLVAGESPALTETIEAAFSDALSSAKREAFVDESRAEDFYFAQNGSGRCTITSVAMMVRRAAFLDGRSDWQDLGLDSVTADGWCSAGVKWELRDSWLRYRHHRCLQVPPMRCVSSSMNIPKASPHMTRTSPMPFF